MAPKVCTIPPYLTAGKSRDDCTNFWCHIALQSNLKMALNQKGHRKNHACGHFFGIFYFPPPSMTRLIHILN